MQGIAGTGWPAPPSPYIEDWFSTWLYTGNGGTQTITNGINLSTNGGLVWIKSRTDVSGTPQSHVLIDTARGVSARIQSDTTDAQYYQSGAYVTAFNSSGFDVAAQASTGSNTYPYASWTFAKRSKFFDIVTWTGNGAATQTISHNLGSVPGCIIAKITSSTDNWYVYHRGASGTPLQSYLRLNLTNAVNTSGSDLWGATSTTITVDSGLNLTTNGATYVAYIFAHNAGGFGLTGSDNVISCGSYTGNGSATGPVVTLGYEPQWLMIKRATGTLNGNWVMLDVMRGFNVSTDNDLYANLSNAEGTGLDLAEPQATGFQIKSGSSGVNANTDTYIYIAIRRGPMKVPTDATKVFVPTAFTTNNSSSQVISVGFPSGMALGRERTTTANLASQWPIGSRLTGNGFLRTSQTGSEITYVDMVNGWDDQNSIDLAGIMVGNGSYTEILYNFQRAPSFFDEVCYTGTGTATLALTHNLGVVPEMMIVKSRSDTSHWMVYVASQGNTKELQLERTNAVATNTNTWGSTTPTSTQFTVGCIVGSPDTESTNDSGYTYVAYLFATCAGVSKVGSYTGTGTLTTINCGFSGGARFVLIKRTDSTSDWYVWDTSRGMTAGTDPSLSLNTTAAESNANSVYTITTGFQLLASPSADVNTNAGTYIYLAIA
jgi:hypothetical protein